MSSLLLDLHRQEDNTMLIITHHPHDVRALADSVLFLDEGRILLHEPTETFLNHRGLPAVERFVGR